MATGSDYCGSGGCATSVLERRGSKDVTIFSQNLYDSLAVTNEKIGGYAALAIIDDKGKIAIDGKEGTPMHGKQMVYPMRPEMYP